MKYLRRLLLRPAGLLFSSATLLATPPADFTGSYSYSGPGSLSRNGPAGEVAVHHVEGDISFSAPVRDSLQFAYGLAGESNELISDGAAVLPGRLAALSLSLGLIRNLDSDWTMAIFARPGFYGDFERLGARSVNVPVFLLFTRTVGPTLTFTLALSYNGFAKNPVLPLPGVRWAFAPEWELSVGLPRTAIIWQATDAVSWHAGVTYQGGSFRITREPSGATGLAGSLLDYRELHAGVGFDYKLGGDSVLSFDAGFTADRRFDYHQRGRRYDGDSAAFVKLAYHSRL